MNDPIPEFSRLINAARLSPTGIHESLQAKPNEREALAKRFDLVKLSSLTAQLTVQPGSSQTIAVTGKISADVVQRCVITLDPLSSHINVNVDITFIPAEQNNKGAGSDDLDDEFELFSQGKIDLGEMVAQHLGVALDPYPRKPDAALPATEFGATIDKRQPFAQLADALKSQEKKDKTKN